MTSELPGPGLELEVDVSGDGSSTFGDRYAFNYWLELGGDLETALAAAKVRETTIDLTDFFRSTDAQLEPQATETQVQASSSSSGYTGCPTSGVIESPFAAPEMPASLFGSCQNKFRFPTGCEVDPDQGLWCSRGHPAEKVNDKGVVRLLDLIDIAPPKGQDGSIPLDSPGIDEVLAFAAEDIVTREIPPTDPGRLGCDPGPRALHAMSTWPGDHIICRSGVNFGTEGLCNSACGEISPSSEHIPSTDPPMNEPFAVDAYREGMPPDAFPDPTVSEPMVEEGHFIAPEDLVFSDKTAGGVVKIRRSRSPDSCTPANSVVTTIHTFDSTVAKVWGLALGDFNGAGAFGAYIILEELGRNVRRVNPDNTLDPLRRPPAGGQQGADYRVRSGLRRPLRQ